MKTHHETRKVEYSFTLIGIIMAIAIIAMTSMGFGLFFTGVIETMNISANSSYAKYDFSAQLQNYSTDLNRTVFSSPLTQESSLYDIVGSYFKLGWTAVKTAVNSLLITQKIMLYAYEDAPPQVQGFITVFVMLIGIIVFILFLQALLKWYI